MLKPGSGDKSIFLDADPSSHKSVAYGFLKARQIHNFVHEIKVLHRSDTDLNGSDLANIEPPQIASSGSDGTIPNRFQIFIKTPKGNTTVVWT